MTYSWIIMQVRDTALHLASRNGHEFAVGILLNHDADVHAKNDVSCAI